MPPPSVSQVTLTFFDTAYMQVTRVYHSYTPYTDMLRHTRFSNMKTWEAVMRHDITEDSVADVVVNQAERLLKGIAKPKPKGDPTASVRIRELHHIVDIGQLNQYTSVEAKAESGYSY